jgi:hypothetical protein
MTRRLGELIGLKPLVEFKEPTRPLWLVGRLEIIDCAYIDIVDIQFRPPLSNLTFLCDILILQISDSHDNISWLKDNIGEVKLPYHKNYIKSEEIQ